MPEKKLLPKHLWMIEKKGSLEKVTSCVTGYTYIQDTNFTVSENSTIGYVVYYDGCNGWRCWCHSVEVKAVNTFHNDIFLEDFHHETDGWPCTQPASDYVGRYYSDNTYSAGAKFFVSSKYYNDFDSSSGCSTPAGLDLAHPGSVTLSAGGGTDSVTFDYMIMKASSASSNCSQVVCDSGTEE